MSDLLTFPKIARGALAGVLCMMVLIMVGVYVRWELAERLGGVDLQERLNPYFNAHLQEEGALPLLDPLFVLVVSSWNLVVFGSSGWVASRIAGPRWRGALVVVLLAAGTVGLLRHIEYLNPFGSGIALASTYEFAVSILMAVLGAVMANRQFTRAEMSSGAG